MKRTQLISALRSAIEQVGYNFYSGFDYTISRTVKAYPAGWLNPVRITTVKGREQGRIVYQITLRLMELAPRDATSHDEIWGVQESDALEIARLLAEADVVTDVADVKCTPAQFSLTNHGELSMTLDMNVGVLLCE